MSEMLSRVTCGHCNEPLLVWKGAERYYVGCAYRGCSLTALPREADVAVAFAHLPPKRDAAQGGA